MPSPVPQHCPTPRELDDLELLISGALAPLTRFDEEGSPVTLSLPAELADAEEVELVDPEGLPLARIARRKRGWKVEPLSRPAYGPFRRLYLSPAETRERFAGRTVVPITGPVTDAQLDHMLTLGPLLLLPLVGAGTPDLSPVALLRATLRVAEAVDAAVVAVPLASHGDAEADHELGVRVVTNYAGDDPVVGLVEGGEVLPDLDDIVDADKPAPDAQGLVLFFTGLSGSGKSTLARALMDRLLEQGGRTVTTLDGDVVRRHLSAGLTFSKADRETNIRRIGWVAAEISRHGGVAVCSPIAPFDQTRQQVRAMVEEAGGAFFLVHVATPLEECERRDRKGLYAKARAGEIPEFTGISSPYEEPHDADVRVDTTGRTIEDALDDVVGALRDAGYLDLATPVVEEAPQRRHPVVEEAGHGRLETTDPQDDDTSPRLPTIAADPLRVVFVCTANICRSPFMQLLAARLAADVEHADVEFTSAGTRGFTARAMDPVMATTLASRGLTTTEIEAFASRPLSDTILEEADLVLTAEESHRTFILDDHPSLFRRVVTLGQFADAVRAADPDLVGRDLVTEVGRRRGSTSPEHDVGDPYGRGTEAAERAAVHMDELLRVVVPRLAASARMLP